MKKLPSSYEVLSSELARLSDKGLLAEVAQVAGDERGATARLVATLVEVDKRLLYRDAGCSSLYTFCTQVLGLSENEAYLRMEAARGAGRFPLILERMGEGSLTLTAVSMLARHLTKENHVALLDEARHKSKREVEAIIARIRPRPDAVSIVRRLPVAPVVRAANMLKSRAEDRRAGREGADEAPAMFAPEEGVSTARVAIGRQALEGRHEEEDRNRISGMPLAPRAEEELVPSQPPNPAAQAASVVPQGAAAVSIPTPRWGPRSDVTQLSPERYRVQVTIGAGTHEKLRRAQDLLRHVVPDGDLEEVFDRAIALLLAELEKTRLGATSRPRLPRLIGQEARAPKEPVEGANQPGAGDGHARSESPHGGKPESECDAKIEPTKPDISGHTRRRSRHIPSAVKRQVVQRDGLRCTFVGRDGRRCSEKGLLEFHHLEPFAAGGRDTASNVVVACRRHNALEAERFFGRSGVPRSRVHSEDRTATTGHVDNLAINSVQSELGIPQKSSDP